MEDISIVTIIAATVSAIIAFLIGKSGVLTRIFDTRIRKVEDNQKKESNMIDDAIRENKELRAEVTILNKKVNQLESQVKNYEKSIKLIIEYLKEQGITDPFLDKIVK